MESLTFFCGDYVSAVISLQVDYIMIVLDDNGRMCAFGYWE